MQIVNELDVISKKGFDSFWRGVGPHFRNLCFRWMTPLRGFAKLRNRKLVAETDASNYPRGCDWGAACWLAGPLSLPGHSHLLLLCQQLYSIFLFACLCPVFLLLYIKGQWPVRKSLCNWDNCWQLWDRFGKTLHFFTSIGQGVPQVSVQWLSQLSPDFKGLR